MQEQQLFRGWPKLRFRGVLVTVATLVLLQILRVLAVPVPNPVIVALLAVVYAVYAGGRWEGMVSAILVVVYNAFHFSEQGHLFHYTRENAGRLMVILVGVPSVAGMLMILKQKAEAASADLRKSEKRLRDITATLGEGVFVLDQQGLIRFVNPEAERLLGWNETELLGRSVRETLVSSADEECALLNTVLLGRCYRTDCASFTRKDGTAFPASCVSTPILEGRTIAGSVTVFRDITVQKRAEAELNRLYQTIRLQNAMLEVKVQERTKELHDAHLELVQRLGRAAEYRDNETGFHIIRMGQYSALLGRAAGMTEAECEMLLHASPMHDIGKIGIPDRILLKPGKLDPEEWEIMKTHTLIGSELLSGSSSPLMQMAAIIAETHHEKWDGSGYPHGLKGEEIPLVGRICALCDVFDALTTERPYKKAWSVADAVAEIERGSGTHFDPRLVELFKQMLPEILAVKDRYADPLQGESCREYPAASRT